MSGLSLATVKAVMKRIAKTQTADFDVLGITVDDFEMLTGEDEWSVANKRQVVNSIDAFLFSTLDLAGVARHAIPAEVVAGVVGTVVAPKNQLLAANWIAQHADTGKPIHELAAGGDPMAIASVNPSQIYALLILAESEGLEARKVFEKRIAAMNTPGV
jgi:hypothetical protein